MGTVVQFPTRQGEAAEKAEAILAKICEHYRRQMKAKEELPAVLAALVKAGESELVLRAVRLWGTGEMAPDHVLEMCQKDTGPRKLLPRGPLF